MSSLSTLDTIAQEKAIMVVRAPSVTAAMRSIEAAVDGGMRVIEVTFTVPDAADVIKAVAQDERLTVGAGTVLNEAQTDAALDAGAQFVVSPGLGAAVVSRVIGADALMLPGVFTSTEVMNAIDLGAPAVKLFPAGLAGPAHIKTLRGPFPHLQVIPSGGVTSDNAAEWLAAGAVAVGLAGSLSPASENPDVRAITAEAQRVIAAVRAHTNEITRGELL